MDTPFLNVICLHTKGTIPKVGGGEQANHRLLPKLRFPQTSN